MSAMVTRLIILSFIGLLAIGATSAAFGEERVRSFAAKSLTDGEMDEIDGGFMQAQNINATLIFLNHKPVVANFALPDLNISAVKIRVPPVRVLRLNAPNLSLTKIRVGPKFKLSNLVP